MRNPTIDYAPLWYGGTKMGGWPIRQWRTVGAVGGRCPHLPSVGHMWTCAAHKNTSRKLLPDLLDLFVPAVVAHLFDHLFGFGVAFACLVLVTHGQVQPRLF